MIVPDGLDPGGAGDFIDESPSSLEVSSCWAANRARYSVVSSSRSMHWLVEYECGRLICGVSLVPQFLLILR